MASILRRNVMDPILYGFTLGVLFTTGVALWQKVSRRRRQTTTTDTITNSSSRTEKQSS